MNPEKFDDISEAKKKEFADFEKELAKHDDRQGEFAGFRIISGLGLKAMDHREVMCSDGTNLKIPEGYEFPEEKPKYKTDFVGDAEGNLMDLDEEAKKKEFADFEKELTKHDNRQGQIGRLIFGKKGRDQQEVMCSDGTRLKIPEGYEFPKDKPKYKTNFVGDEKGNIEDLHPNK